MIDDNRISTCPIRNRDSCRFYARKALLLLCMVDFAMIDEKTHVLRVIEPFNEPFLGCGAARAY